MDSWIQAAMQAEDYASALTCARAMRATAQGEQLHWAVWKEAQCLQKLGQQEELLQLAATADAGKYGGRLYSLAAELTRGEPRFDRFAALAARATEDLDWLRQAWTQQPGPELACQRIELGLSQQEPEEAFAGHLGLLELAEERQDRNLACLAWQLMDELKKVCYPADYLHELVPRWERLSGLLAPAERQAWEEGRKAYQAGAAGEQALFEQLLVLGVSPDACDVAGRTAAFGAAMTGAVGMLEWLRDHRADLDRPNYQLLSPLMVAVMEGKTEVVELLLPRHAKVDRRGPGGNTALHFAVSKNRLEIAEILMRRGANPALANQQGETPRSLAEAGENEDLHRLLRPAQGGLLGGLLRRKS